MDLSDVTFIDPEGSNFIILLPYLLSKHAEKVLVQLPFRDDVSTFIKDSGIIDHFTHNKIQSFRQLSLFINNSVPNPFSFNKVRSPYSYIPFFKTYYLNSNSITDFYRSMGERTYIFEKNSKLFSRATICINELLNNMLQHSEIKAGSVTIQFRNVGKFKEPYMFMSITDFGIGIKKSLLKSSLFQTDKIKRQDDEFFINAALQPGISSTNLSGRGAGLSIVLNKSDKIIIASGKKKDINQ